MSYRIVYKPSRLYLRDLIHLETQCFPDEQMDKMAFSGIIDNEFWVSLSGSRVNGYGYLKITPELAWIVRVGVANKQRNKGIGAQLMDAMLKRCEELERNNIILYVRQDNPAAIHLYRKFDFDVAEESFQYIIEKDWFDGHRDCMNEQELTVSPVVDVPEQMMPVFTDQWSNLADLHDPPRTHVFVFLHETLGSIGYCRLNPEFPGCFPFELRSPSIVLSPALGALEPYLSKNHSILKLTLSDPMVANACGALGFRLNYRLYKMIRISTVTPVEGNCDDLVSKNGRDVHP